MLKINIELYLGWWLSWGPRVEFCKLLLKAPPTTQALPGLLIKGSLNEYQTGYIFIHSTINYRTAHTYQALYQELAAQNDQAVNLTMHPQEDYNPPPCQETWQGMHNIVSTPRELVWGILECQRREEIPWWEDKAAKREGPVWVINYPPNVAASNSTRLLSHSSVGPKPGCGVTMSSAEGLPRLKSRCLSSHFHLQLRVLLTALSDY